MATPIDYNALNSQLHQDATYLNLAAAWTANPYNAQAHGAFESYVQIKYPDLYASYKAGDTNFAGQNSFGMFPGAVSPKGYTPPPQANPSGNPTNPTPYIPPQPNLGHPEDQPTGTGMPGDPFQVDVTGHPWVQALKDALKNIKFDPTATTTPFFPTPNLPNYPTTPNSSTGLPNVTPQNPNTGQDPNDPNDPKSKLNLNLLKSILKLAAPLLAVGIGKAVGGPGGSDPGPGGNVPPDLKQLLGEALSRVAEQRPLFDAVTGQAYAGLPDYVKQGQTGYPYPTPPSGQQ